MEVMSREELKNLIAWIESRLLFAEKLITDAQLTKNYGKEMHYIAKREVYQEMLSKLKLDSQ
jgi:hypothetical protein